MRIPSAALLALAVFVATSAWAAEEFTIEDIRVEGLQRISAGTVFNYLPLEVGDTLTPQSTEQAIRALFDTGFFSDIAFKRQGNILVIEVSERPAIARIDITGNKAIETEQLRGALQQIGLQEGEIFNQLELDRIQKELTRQYFRRGKYSVVVDARVNELARNRVDVDIVISEGDTAKIKHINIVGNEAFDEKTLLDDWESQITNFTSWYTSDDQYSREKLSGDLEALASYYMDRGYIEFERESTQVQISPDKQEMYLTVNINEGEVYKVDEVKLTGDMVIDKERLEALVQVQSGEVFSRKEMERSIENIKAVLSNIGYAFAEVLPHPEVNREDRTVDLTLFVNPGKRVYVRRVEFSGNTKTLDEVLRREMRQFEGAWFSQAAIDRSRLRLQRLGYFKNVEIETPRVPGRDDQVDVNVTVEERRSGSFSFGVGFGQTTGFLFNVNLQQDNFFGSGKSLGLNVNTSRVFTRFGINYQNPYWTKNGVSRGFSFNYREVDNEEVNISAFDSQSIAFGVNFGLPITEVDRIRVGASIERSTFSSASPDIEDDLLLFGTDEFESLRTSVSWIHDTRNHFLNPTRGSRQRLRLSGAVPGSTSEFVKAEYRGKKFFPLGGQFALAFRANVGVAEPYGDEDIVFINDRFFAGGVRDVRAFRENEIGPEDQFGNALGGQLKVTGGAEIAFPVPFMDDQSSTRLAWFADFGSVYEDVSAFDAGELRASTGISLTWEAPVGPLVLNLGIPFNEQPGDETETFQFSFGNAF